MKKNSTHSSIKCKIHNLESIKKISEKYKKKKKKIILCHGTFDLLHAGHYRHFQEAKDFGDLLIVSITADKFINKGPGRPVFNELLRAEMIASLSYVDFVIIINEASAISAIESVKPNIYVKGDDYRDKSKDLTNKIILEESKVKENGGFLKYTSDITFSSSSLINKNFPVFDQSLIDFLSLYKKEGIEYFISLTDKLKDKKVLVVGESIIDEYIYTETLGKSAKESILATLKKSNQVFAGGAVAAANHISEFCKKIFLVTGIGDKNTEDRNFIKNSLAKNVTLCDIKLKNIPTTKKTRFVDNSYLRKMFEVYDMDDTQLTNKTESKVIDEIKNCISDVDIIIIADFGHGFLTQKIINFLVDSGVYIGINAQTNSANRGFNLITKYKKANYICIDEPEFRLAVHDKNTAINSILKNKKNLPKSNLFAVTTGKGGCHIKSGEKIIKIPAFTNNVVDTLGAGDAFFVVSTLYSYLNINPLDIGFIGNVAGALKVNILGHSSHIKKNHLLKFIESVIK